MDVIGVGIGIWICRMVQLAPNGDSDIDELPRETEVTEAFDRKHPSACYSPAEIRVWWPHPPHRGRNAGR